MPEVVEAGVRELGTSEGLLEGPADRRGMVRAAQNRREDVPAVARALLEERAVLRGDPPAANVVHPGP